MKIWLKSISEEDGKEYCDLLIELARYPDENVQRQRSVAHIDGELIGIHDGYHFYKVKLYF